MSPQPGDSPLPSEGPATKKKKRIVGVFPCPNCSKTFTRADHLSRHFLNHKPKEVYVCEYELTGYVGQPRKCGKTFVRKDLRARHYRRHLAEAEKSDDPSAKLASSKSIDSKFETPKIEHDTPSATQNSPFSFSHKSDTPTTQRVPHPDSNLSQSEQTILPDQNVLAHTSVVSQYVPPGAEISAPELSQNHSAPGFNTLSHESMTRSGVMNTTPHDPSSHYPMTTNQERLNDFQYPLAPQHPAASQRDSFRAASTVPYSEGDIISWLFTDNSLNTGLYQTGGVNLAADQIGHGQEITDYQNHTQIPSEQQIPVGIKTEPSENFQLENQVTPHFQHPYAPNQSDHTIPYIPPTRQMPGPELKGSPNSWPSPFYPAPKDLLYNNGLQDLNYFFNNDNPLEDLLNTSPRDSLSIMGLIPSTVSSTSPSQSNDSNTPRSLTDAATREATMDLFEMNARSITSELNTQKNKQIYVDRKILSKLFDQIPSLDEVYIRSLFPDYQGLTLGDRFCFFLQCYWDTFQPKFSILHRPSFCTETAEPLLLLAMICVGSMYSACSTRYSEQQRKCPELKFCMYILQPLRFTLFQHHQFKSPVRVWILQTLNLLEWCEKNYLLREMHERAHIHHGTTVQLLRRSPFLGGNPAVANKAANSASDTATSGGEDEHSDGVSDLEDQMSSDQTTFNKWVESESMKRITFMTFYLDIMDYIKFRHNPQIPFFQLQLLNLPCDEEQLWNNEEINGSFQKVVKRQRKLQRSSNLLNRGVKDEPNRIRPGMNFLSAMKRILKSQREKVSFVKTSVFVKNILLGGIASLMHLMQQSEFQNSFTALVSPADKTRNSVWKAILVKALDNCEADLFPTHSTLSNESCFRADSLRCKFPMYHLLQIIGLSDINHYDIAIFGGSPKNMSVDATSKDQQLVQRKLHSIWNASHWLKTSNDVANVRSVIHCYWLLWKVMLAPMDDNGKVNDQQWARTWQIEFDFFDIMYPLSVSMLVLWCYTFATYGPESRIFSVKTENWAVQDFRDYNKLTSLSTENGYQYLARLRNELVQATKASPTSKHHVLHQRSSSRAIALEEVMKSYCEKLPILTDQKNISGLCFLVGTTLLKSQWEVIRENAKLIINCGLRSIGKENVHCTDLFDNEFDN
ncbi:hypothetical protein PUMCH_000152 [Australozyma saopauloensis]|uniref:C2H2-type domain-containing protein n=1 Tax=Australozyma saopauloensis TaxID=291208 RepID=A0AAX4H410_9ASCO|nr:hypothetical protein PUMCH_000152 [[Candida] saopauloensis]